MSDTQINIGINLDSDSLVKGIDNAQYKIKALGNIISGVSVAALEAALSNLPTQKIKDAANSFESVSKSLQNTPVKDLSQPIGKINAKEIKGVGEAITALSAAMSTFDANKLSSISQGLLSVSISSAQIQVPSIQKLAVELKSINKVATDIQPTNLQNTASAIKETGRAIGDLYPSLIEGVSKAIATLGYQVGTIKTFNVAFKDLNKDLTGLNSKTLSDVADASLKANPEPIKQVAVSIKELNKSITGLFPSLLIDVASAAKQISFNNAAIKLAAENTTDLSKSINNLKSNPFNELSTSIKTLNPKSVEVLSSSIKSLEKNVSLTSSNNLNEISKSVGAIASQLTSIQSTSNSIKSLSDSLKEVDFKPLKGLVESIAKINSDPISKLSVSIGALNKEATGLSSSQILQVSTAINQLVSQLSGIKESSVNLKELSKNVNDLKPAPLAQLTNAIKSLSEKQIESLNASFRLLDKAIIAISSSNLYELGRAVNSIVNQSNAIQLVSDSVKSLGASLKLVDHKPLSLAIEASNKANPEQVKLVSNSVKDLSKSIMGIFPTLISDVAFNSAKLGEQNSVIKAAGINFDNLATSVKKVNFSQISDFSKASSALSPKNVDSIAVSMKSLGSSIMGIFPSILTDTAKSAGDLGGKSLSIKSTADAVQLLSTSLSKIQSKPLDDAVNAAAKATHTPLLQTADAVNKLSTSINGIFPILLSDVAFAAQKISFQNSAIKLGSDNTKDLAKSILELKTKPFEQLSGAINSLSPKSIGEFSSGIKSLDKSINAIAANPLNEVGRYSSVIIGQTPLIQLSSESFKSLGTSLKTVDYKPLSSVVDAANKANPEPIKQVSNSINSLNKSIMGIFPTLISDVAFNTEKLGAQNATIKIAATNFDSLAVAIKKVNFNQITDFSKATSSLSPKNIDAISASMKVLGSSVMNIFPSILTDTAKGAGELGSKSTALKSTAGSIQALSSSLGKLQVKPLEDAVKTANQATHTPLTQTAVAVTKLTAAINGIFPTLLSDVAFAAQKISFHNSSIKLAADNTKDLARSILELKAKPFEQLSSAIGSLTPKAIGDFSNGIKSLDKSISSLSSNNLNDVSKSAASISSQSTSIQGVATSIKLLSDSIKEVDHKPLKNAVESGNKANAEPISKTAIAVKGLAKEISEVSYASLSNVAVAAGQIYLQASRIKETASNIKELGLNISSLATSSDKISSTAKNLEKLLVSATQISKVSAQINSQKIIDLDVAISKINTTILPVIASQLKEVADASRLISNANLKKLTDNISIINVNKLNETTTAVLGLSPALNNISTSNLSLAANYLKQIIETKKGISDLSGSIKELNAVTQKVASIPFANASKELDNLGKKITAVNSNKILDIGSGLELIGSTAVKLNPQVVSFLSKNISDLTKQTPQLNVFAGTIKTLSSNVSAINSQTVNALATAVSKLNETKTESTGKALKNIGDAISSLKTSVLLDTAAGLELIGTSQSFVAQTSKHIINVSNALAKMSSSNKQLASVSDNIGYIGINVGTIKSGILNNLANYSEQLGRSAPKLKEFRDVLREISKVSDSVKTKGLVTLTNVIVGINANKIVEISLDLIDLSKALSTMPVEQLKQLNSAMKVSVGGNLKVTADSLERVGKSLLAISPQIITDAVNATKGFAGTRASVQGAATSLSSFAKANNEIKAKQLELIGKAFDLFANSLTKLDTSKIVEASGAIQKLSVVIANINTQPLLNTAAGVANIGVIAKVTTKEINALFDALSKPQQTPEQKAAAEAERQRLKEEKEAKKALAEAERQRLKEEKAAQKAARDAEKAALKEAIELEKSAAKEIAAAKKAENEAIKKANKERADQAKQLLKEEIAAKKAAERELKAKESAKSPELEQWASTRGFRESFQEIGGEIKRFFGESFNVFKEFDDQVRKAASLMGGKFIETVDEINRKSLKLSETTRYTATQISESFGVLAMNGLNLKEAMTAIPVVLDLAEAGAFSVEKTTEILIGTMHSFNLGVDGMKSVANSMTNAMATSALSMQRIAYTVQYAGTTAAAANQTFHQMAGIMGVLANQNIVGSKAGTALRTIYLELQVEGGKLTRTLQDLAQKQAASSGIMGENSESIKQFATSQKDATGATRPLIDVLEDMKVKGAKAGDVFNAFGKYAMGAALAIIKPGESMAESIDKVRVQQERTLGITEKSAKQFVLNMRNATSETSKVLTQMGIDVLATDSKIGKTTAIKDLFSVMAEAKKKGTDFSEIAKSFVDIKTDEGRKEFDLLIKTFNSGKKTAKEFADTYSELNGRAHEVAAQMESGVGGAVRKLQGAYQGLQIKIYDAFSGEITKKILDVKDSLMAATPAITNIAGFFIKAGLAVTDLALSFLKFTDYHSGALIAIGAVVSAVVVLKYQLIELTAAMLGRVVGGFVATSTAIGGTVFSVSALSSALIGLGAIAKNLGVITVFAASAYEAFQLLSLAVKDWQDRDAMAAKSNDLVKTFDEREEKMKKAGFLEKNLGEISAENLRVYRKELASQLGIIDEIKMRKESGLKISAEEESRLAKEIAMRGTLAKIQTMFKEDPRIKQSEVALNEERAREAAKRKADLDSQSAKYKKLNDLQVSGEIAYTQALMKGNAFLEEREKYALQKQASIDISKLNQETAAMEARARATISTGGTPEKINEGKYLDLAKRRAEIEAKLTNDLLKIEQNRLQVSLAQNDKIYLLKRAQAENTVKDGDQLNRKLNDLDRENIEARIQLQEKYYKSVQTSYQKVSKELEDYKAKSISIEKEIANEKMSLQDKLFELKIRDKTEEEKGSAYKSRADEMIAKSRTLVSSGDIEGGRKALEQAEQLAGKLKDISAIETLIKTISSDRVKILEQEKVANDEKAAVAEKQQKDLQIEETTSLSKLKDFQNEVGKLSETGTSVKLEAVLDVKKVKEEFEKLRKEAEEFALTVNVHHTTSGGEGFSQNPQMHNSGGWVGGTGNSDTVPAMLTPTEYVVTARQDRSKKAAPILEFLNNAPISKVSSFIDRVKNGVSKLNSGGFVMPRLNTKMLMDIPNLGNLPSPSAPKDRYLQPFVLNLGGKNMPPLPTPEENMREFILALQQT